MCLDSFLVSFDKTVIERSCKADNLTVEVKEDRIGKHKHIMFQNEKNGTLDL